ncbi:MAG TPA: hypothetical protein VE825_15315 [Terriglobales bacterium]|jgi:hypothetical protein|nr:hypothetical protein [Terriglobales bacterium]
MRSRRAISVVILGLAVEATAQHGIAPSGYYPANYNGDTFTGVVVESADPQALTLQYSKKGKTETFVARPEAPCMAAPKSDPHEQKELHLSHIPKDSIVTAFYYAQTVHENGQNKKENVIIGIRFDRLNGQDLTQPTRPMISCTKAQTFPFRAF